MREVPLTGLSSENESEDECVYHRQELRFQALRLGRGQKCIGLCLLIAAVLATCCYFVFRDRSKEAPAAEDAEVKKTAATVMQPSAAPAVTAAPSRAPSDASEVVSADNAPDKGVSLYCFTMLLPFGHEKELVKVQYERKLSIFECDEHTVFSNVSFELSPGRPGGEWTVAVEGDMSVQFNDWTWAKFGTKLALNTGVFLRVWRKVFEMGLWQDHDWTVKVDPDTVFLSSRLEYLLRERPLMPPPGTEELNPLTCGTCKLANFSGDSCVSHVTYEQSQGLTCLESLQNVARDPPQDCGCKCTADICKNPSSAYLRNCAVNMYEPTDKYPVHAMHGPLEVLSKQAVRDLEAGLDSCVSNLSSSFSQWGEDWFLEKCLILLQVNPVDSFSSLKDGDCQTRPWPCTAAHAAFQPFKDVYGYLKCTENAAMNGSWPPEGLQYDEHKYWSDEVMAWVTRD